MAITISVSVGEFVDKLTILQIKAERISEPDKLNNVRRELEELSLAWTHSQYSRADGIDASVQELKRINEDLWDIEDAIREKESRSEFDKDFIELARSVYLTNDRRAAVKREINRASGSALTEEKSYREYR